MKKILGLLIAGLLGLNIFAAALIGTIDKVQGAGVMLSQGGELTLTFRVEDEDGTTNFVPVFPSAYTHFGYYLMDAKNNMTSWEEIDLATLQNGSTLLGNFATGTRMAFWAADEYGAYMDSMNRDGEKGETRDSAYVNNNSGVDTAIAMGSPINGGGGWGSVALRDLSTDTHFIFRISSNGDATSGQPLPGIAAVLLIGGAATVIRRKFKKA